MNAVEIEEAVSRLAEVPFDGAEFPFAFLEAFWNKATTLKRLRSEQGSSNQSDVGGVLQRNNISQICKKSTKPKIKAQFKQDHAKRHDQLSNRQL